MLARLSTSFLALLVWAWGIPCSVHSAPYDNAPEFILGATLLEMALPPSYNLYVENDKYDIYPIDIWYRLKFDDSGKLVSHTPVYSTRNDSALIRSTTEFPLWHLFQPGKDSTHTDSGYLVRIGYREWRGQCNYEAVPDPADDTGRQYDALPVMVGNDSIPLPRFFYDPQFRAQTRVEYYVNEYGDVCAALILESSGMALFDLYALDVAECWHYRPAVADGIPIGIWMNWLIGTGDNADGTNSDKR